MKRWMSLFLVVTLLLGTLPPAVQAQVPTPGYNPYQGSSYNPYLGTPNGVTGRYDRQYGQRYNGNYYQTGGSGYTGGYGFTRIIPPAVGAVLGLAMGARFGMVGALLGGAIGLFAGKAISEAAFGNSYYQAPPNGYFQPSNRANYLPGMLGAAIGAWMGSSFGIVGMLVGGGVGYLFAKAVSRMLFPNAYYGYGGGFGGPFAAGDSDGPVPPAASADVEESTEAAAPAAPTGDLESLKDALYESMRSYKDALTGDDEAAKVSARADFLGAQRAYFDAKEALLGSK